MAAAAEGSARGPGTARGQRVGIGSRRGGRCAPPASASPGTPSSPRSDPQPQRLNLPLPAPAPGGLPAGLPAVSRSASVSAATPRTASAPLRTESRRPSSTPLTCARGTHRPTLTRTGSCVSPPTDAQSWRRCQLRTSRPIRMQHEGFQRRRRSSAPHLGAPPHCHV